ncbi:aminotransferase class V-fold PLP-dependent enzyme [Hugenholtzia roseola]|uniref:aminotransferase class V-fold PLP-dependent enzyme n=1 Tax=Hugenholtzia roseola TaxID=1002 RepID=UPI0003FEA6A6|nr:aminotransferase class V-fold PLP-dependent enzyme [Hugenholtzia roseola]
MKFYLTPGPSELYPSVADHLRSALRQKLTSISHRSQTFKDIYAETEKNLRLLLAIPDHFHLVFASSANEIWERIIQNTVALHCTHLVNGSFSSKFADFAQKLGKNTSLIEVPFGKGFQAENFGEPANDSSQTEMLAIIQNETSSGVSFDENLMALCQKQYPTALIQVDAVSSLPYYTPDFTRLDGLYFSVQKGFGLPAGLGVWIFSEKVLEKAKTLQAQLAEKGSSIGSYHALPDWLSQAQNHQTPETPNVLGIYLLGKVCGDMLERGIKTIRQETNYKAALLYDALERSQLFTPFVAPAHRSKTVLVADFLAEKSQKSLSQILQLFENEGLIIGKGYGKYKESQIRIANFPSHSKELAEKLADLILKY